MKIQINDDKEFVIKPNTEYPSDPELVSEIAFDFNIKHIIKHLSFLLRVILKGEAA